MILNSRLDPYLLWRLASDERFRLALFPKPREERGPATFPAKHDQALFAVLVERRSADLQLIDEDKLLSPGSNPLLKGLNDAYAPLHTHVVSPEARHTKFQPGLVNAYGLRLLMEALNHLDDPAVNLVRWELSHTGEPLGFALGAGISVSVDPSASQARQVQGDPPIPFIVAAKKLAEQLKQGPSPSPAPASRSTNANISACRPTWLSVIDDGCNFASTKLSRPGGSVVKEILLQSTDPDQLLRMGETGKYTPGLDPVSLNPENMPRGTLLGMHLETSQFAAASKGQAPDLALEPNVYRISAYMHPTPHGRHGAAVLDLIANPRLWIGRQPAHRRAPAQVHFVQLPSSTVVDTSGGSLSAQALTGIHEALFRAPDNSDVLVNLSFGNHSGAHDGNSMIELAIVELLDLYDGSALAKGKRLMVVVPAGNSHLLRCHAQGHACVNKPSVIDWKVLPDDDTDNFIEIWLPKGRLVEVHVTAPDGAKATLRTQASPCAEIMPVVKDTDTEAAGVMFYTRTPPQSQNAALLLLAVGGNMGLKQADEKFRWRRSFSFYRTPAPECEYAFGNAHAAPKRAPHYHGVWHIEIRNVSSADTNPVPWHAYVQRGDVAPLRRRSARGVFGRQSYILDDGESRADPMFTLNGIATASHPRLFVVGAMERADGRLSPYSASGPRVPPGLDQNQDPGPGNGRVCGPCWVVPADESRRLHGLLVGGMLSGSQLRMSGTSMAAATFTRHLWEHLDAGHALEAFCGPAPRDEPAPTVHPAGEPCYAPDFCRGETHRVLSTRPDGALCDGPRVCPQPPPSAKSAGG